MGSRSEKNLEPNGHDSDPEPRQSSSSSSTRASLEMLCRSFGFTRQAYYKRQKREEREAIREDLIVQEVIRIREVQKRIGGANCIT